MGQTKRQNGGYHHVKADDSIYVAGIILTHVLFALTQKAPKKSGQAQGANRPLSNGASKCMLGGSMRPVATSLVPLANLL